MKRQQKTMTEGVICHGFVTSVYQWISGNLPSRKQAITKVQRTTGKWIKTC